MAAGEVTLGFADAQAWHDWLVQHCDRSPGLWIAIDKRGPGVATLTYPEAVEVALTWGWIDGQRRSRDARTFLQRFTPRGARSIWSKINRDKALALIAAGKMQPRGLAEVERAQSDGRWDAAYDSPRSAGVPPDLAAALAANTRAADFFATLDSRNRYAILFRLHHAKKPETRARRVAEFVDMLARGDKIYP